MPAAAAGHAAVFEQAAFCKEKGAVAVYRHGKFCNSDQDRFGDSSVPVPNHRRSSNLGFSVENWLKDRRAVLLAGIRGRSHKLSTACGPLGQTDGCVKRDQAKTSSGVSLVDKGVHLVARFRGAEGDKRGLCSSCQTIAFHIWSVEGKPPSGVQSGLGVQGHRIGS